MNKCKITFESDDIDYKLIMECEINEEGQIYAAPHINPPIQKGEDPVLGLPGILFSKIWQLLLDPKITIDEGPQATTES